VLDVVFTTLLLSDVIKRHAIATNKFIEVEKRSTFSLVCFRVIFRPAMSPRHSVAGFTRKETGKKKINEKNENEMKLESGKVRG